MKIFILQCQENLKEEIGYKIQLNRLKYLGTLLIIQKEGVHNAHNVFICNMDDAITIKVSI
ncbi:MAG: hypothetical protein K1060chlam5_00981 [Candidatus Anoxychlamydiales bacterium]|nr:hypothetical protein [Candidatus Anoxychlamydiales bacterium]